MNMKYSNILMVVAGMLFLAACSSTIELYDNRSEVFTPSPDLEFNNGDIYLEHTVVRDRDTSERVGRLVTRMQVVEAYAPVSEEAPMGDNEFILDCTAEFEDGTITFYGPGKMGELMTNGVNFSVMGGTGRYAGARGTVQIGPVTELRGEPVFPASFRLK